MKRLRVKLTSSADASLLVGQLAQQGRRIFFEYAPAFLDLGLALSPFKLPTGPGLIEHTDMHTFGNMIHADFRIPSSDYADLIKVTRVLTRNHADVLRLFRRMVFNVAAHNRDDHAKNFTFLMNPAREWTLTPAYDLSYATGPGGEHSMTLLGEGRVPGLDHCLRLATGAGIKSQQAAVIIEQVNSAIGRWPEFAAAAGCSAGARTSIARRIGTV